MQKLDPNTDGKTMDIVADNIAKLKTLFPEITTEGSVDFAALKEVLGEYVEEREERYTFTWRGKVAARQAAQNTSTGTLRPCPNLSEHWAHTDNIFIEGDCLEVLKLLQKSYHRKIKMVYIAPPFNKGGDMVYPGPYPDNLDTYLAYSGLSGDEPISIPSNSESAANFHSRWLSMMYPRLLLARNVIKDDGFCVFCIDDSEVHNSRRMLDEIFGEENHLATLVVDKNRKNDAKFFSVGHEYIVIYARDKSELFEKGVKLRTQKEGVDEIKEIFQSMSKKHNKDWGKVREEILNHYKTFSPEDPRKPLMRFTKVDENGPYRTDGDISWPGGGGPQYDVLHPRTKKPCKVPSRGWVFPTYERMKQEIDAGYIMFGPDETTVPSRRRNLFEAEDQVMRTVSFCYAQKTVQNFAKLFDGKKVYDNPQDPEYLSRIINYLTSSDDIVLDMFAGSATTAHAIFLSNVQENSNRKFICIQLPERFDKSTVSGSNAYKLCKQMGATPTATSLACERIRRSAKHLAVLNEDEVDFGFRYFRLDSSNIKKWETSSLNLIDSLTDIEDPVKTGRSNYDILFEILLKYGLLLNMTIDEHIIEKKKVFSVGMGALIVCLESPVTPGLVQGIVDLRDKLHPAIMRVIFRDAAFIDDVIKTNVMQTLAVNGIYDVRSV